MAFERLKIMKIQSQSKLIFDAIVSAGKQNPIAVFDLDSTLYNVSYRNQKILKDFIEHPEFSATYSALLNQLMSVEVDPKDWGLRESIERAGITGPRTLFYDLQGFWRTHFFSSEYLKFDQPYPGAVEYVNALKNHGAQIFYLTGRDRANMLVGTIESLKQWHFPIEDLDSKLIMKSEKGSVEDEEFKTVELSKIHKHSSLIWFFENEPVIVNRVLKIHPNIKTVWINTTHSRRETPSDSALKVESAWTF